MVFNTTLGPQNRGGADGQIKDGGKETNASVVAEEVAVHPVEVTATVYEPARLAEYDDEVAPEIFTLFLFHWNVYPVELNAVKVALAPVQMVTVPVGVIEAVGIGFTVNVDVLVIILPHELVSMQS